MRIVEEEIPEVLPVPPGSAPNYDKDNPIWRIVQAVEALELCADREHYLPETIQHLLPIQHLALYGPSGDQWQIKDPRQQDNKNDFQKQNIRTFTLTGTQIARGFANAKDWSGGFLHLSYAPTPNSPLLGEGGIYQSDSVLLYLRVGSSATQQPITVPYNPLTARYEVELWGLDGDPAPLVGPKGAEAI